ncbi:hypothetical protein [Candidatus Electronema sp. TJ]
MFNDVEKTVAESEASNASPPNVPMPVAVLMLYSGGTPVVFA